VKCELSNYARAVNSNIVTLNGTEILLQMLCALFQPRSINQSINQSSRFIALNHVIHIQ